ncbi:hypothetical protein PR202_gb10801 [Eleusine coracana subsp. coracana]|uniref:AP2/ERF domain-containing protein n=1 Tax=Eleusine coracana subsp. coracana TaxID=191504 RepID=A0AAV5EIK5_ELECO|nr:hypothetical protein PR202_gb10801 [Eleusine coracana subsp. coracana]
MYSPMIDLSSSLLPTNLVLPLHSYKMTSNNSSQKNVSSCSTGGSDAGGGTWLGFSLSPHHMADGPANGVQQQHHHGGIYYPPVSSSSTAPFCYALGGGGGGGQDGFVTAQAAAGGAAFYSALSSMPLRSDGSLCVTEAFRRGEEEQQQHHHGTEAAAAISPKLEDFLGVAGPAMALSLDTSSGFYYGGGSHSHHHEHAAYLQHCAMVSGHDVYSQVAEEEQSAAAMAAGWYAARGGGYEVVNAGATGVDGAALVPAAACHPLALSMSSGSGSQVSCVTMQVAAAQAVDPVAEYIAMEGSKKRSGGGQKQTVQHRKSIDTFGQRTSQYRGVTRHRWTGRYEAHLWDNSCRKEGQARKGRQGGYDMEEKAARAYDLAALKYWAVHAHKLLEDYQEELEEMKNMTRQEYVAHLRRRSSGFSRGASIYRGVTRSALHCHLGFNLATQEEAAEAYDVAAIKFRGLNAVTNFDITRYDVDKIMENNTLLPSELVRRRNKDAAVEVEVDAAAALVQAGNAIEWKTTQVVARTTTTEEQQQNNGHEQQLLAASEAFSAFSALHDIVSVEAAHGGNMSNSSSLATSVSNSREQSPDRGGGLAMLFAKPVSNAASNKLAYSPLPLGSWVSSPSPVSSARPGGVSIAHLPMFAAWTDA